MVSLVDTEDIKYIDDDDNQPLIEDEEAGFNNRAEIWSSINPSHAEDFTVSLIVITRTVWRVVFVSIYFQLSSLVYDVRIKVSAFVLYLFT